MNTGSVKIRHLEDHDYEDVVHLSHRLTTGVAAWRDAASAESAVRSWVEDSLNAADPESRPVFVAIVESEVAGFVTTGRRPHWAGEIDAYVGELVVAEDAAGQGVGRSLMMAAETWARRSGYRRLTLETGAANTEARRFYTAAGYAEEEVILSRAL
ncbi:GNAT family N-acetyltransferase [Brachybacterium tyrofermentans]|uniref:GNAT family N-acetyltransferase n=1 Tax=Brachybacterium tyrofermentans TaxID=47848 RepID=UPI003FD21D0E